MLSRLEIDADDDFRKLSHGQHEEWPALIDALQYVDKRRLYAHSQ